MIGKLTPQEEITVRSYNNGADAWAHQHSDNYWAKEFKTFKKLLPMGKILEIGCGGGRDAKILISMKYDYVGTDVAKNFIEVARKTAPEGKFLFRSVYDLDFKNGFFDGFWASAVFLHIPKTQIDKTLQELRRVIKPGGVGFISVKQGVGEQVIEEKFARDIINKRFWAFYDNQEFADVLNKNNYEIISFRKRPMSKRTTWLIYFVKVKK